MVERFFANISSHLYGHYYIIITLLTTSLLRKGHLYTNINIITYFSLLRLPRLSSLLAPLLLFTVTIIYTTR